MTIATRLSSLALALSLLAGCGGKDNNPGNNGGSNPVLRDTIGINLAQVSAFASVSKPGSTTQPLLGVGVFGSAAKAMEGASQLYALTLTGEVLEVKLVEEGNPQSAGSEVAQPNVKAIFPTVSWVLFSTPGFSVNVPTEEHQSAPQGCGLIAARRADGALFCAPLFANNGWAGRDSQDTILSNAAGDVVFFMSFVAADMGEIDPESFRLYKVELGADGGPTATPALSFPVTEIHSFRVNGAGDLYVNYFPSSLDPNPVTQILPVDGGAAFTVPGTHNAHPIAGELGEADQNTFYVRGGGGVDEGTIQVVTKTGAGFAIQTEQLTVNPLDHNIFSYGGLYRLRDGVYMFSSTEETLARVIEGGAVTNTPTFKVLNGVNSILRLDSTTAISPAAGQLVFIADTGTGREFVRHNGLTQQDIPFSSDIDVTSHMVSNTGAIDFLGTRLSTQEKIRGSVAADATEVVVSTTGVINPAQVVVFTRIN